ncbi:hypothetical protein GCM10022226_15880 [Sphaerisporangium flaviroseum]|uniref:Uncharacterized protein n=1 Tax=Sphaerisporangium flaviroseum TaxID=509199 RepID=A0ABP7HT73_9ACTN
MHTRSAPVPRRAYLEAEGGLGAPGGPFAGTARARPARSGRQGHILSRARFHDYEVNP